MVNLEPGRDYYADLDLTPQATINDVRKQFRKLALKYHPDRNPGQETEFNSKFQAISAANEILTDPALRAKYDTQRLKDGPPKAFGESVPRPNVPPRTRTTNFPPPPRPPPGAAHKANFSPPPTAGGPRRHERAPRPTSSAWGAVDPDEAKAKNNDFKAWESMRHGQGPIPRPRPPPRSAKAGAFEADRTSPPRKEADNVSAKARRRWEDLLDAGMSHLRRPSRSPPGRSAHGREPINDDDLIGKPSAYNVYKGDYPKKTTDMPPPPLRSSKKHDPVHNHVKDPHAHNAARTRQPYHNGVGEKTKASNPGLHRATTTATPRDNKTRPVWGPSDFANLDGDHIRAASAGAANRHEAFQEARVSSSTTSETTSSASSDDDIDSEYVFAKVPASSSAPRPTRQPMPPGTGVRHKSGFSPHVRVDEGQAPHPGYSDLRRHSGIDLGTQSTFADSVQTPNGRSEGPAFGQPSQHRPSLSAHTDSSGRFPQRHKSFDERMQSSLNGNASYDDKSPMYGPPVPSPLSFLHYSGPLPSEKWSQCWPFGPNKSVAPHKIEKPPFWAIPSSLPPTSQRNDAPDPSRSSEKVHKPYMPVKSSANTLISSFGYASNHTKSQNQPPPLRSQSSENISTDFSQAGSPLRFGTDNPFASQKVRHDSNRTATPFERPSFKPDEEWSENQSAASDIPPPPKVGDKWSAEDWEQRIGVHTFEGPADSSRMPSRKRSGTPRAGSSNNLKRTNTLRQAGFQPSVADDDHSDTTHDAQGEDMARSRSSNISDGNAMDIDSTPPGARVNEPDGDISPLSKVQVPMPNINGLPKSARADGMPTSGEDSLRMNLGGFRHVAPFSANDEGLGGVDDLRTALPFESKASPIKPDFSKCHEKLDLPRPPRAPEAPGDLNDFSFREYITHMNHYMFNWNNYNSKVLMTFQRRQEEHREIGQGWIGAVGGDCADYLRALDEDEKGREWWGVATGKHKEAMQNLQMIRQRMLKQKAMA